MKKNYKEVDTCYSCRFCVVIEEYDSSNRYFCNQDKSKRPLSGSVLMKEYEKTTSEALVIARDKFEEWAEDRIVDEYGICDEWKEIK